MSRFNVFFAIFGVFIIGSIACSRSPVPTAEVTNETAQKYEFNGTREEIQGFMNLYRDINLTSQQEEVLVSTLDQRDGNGKPVVSAPCCADETAYTCCCECNMKRASHGLAKKMIVDGAEPAQVREAVKSWFYVVNPSGFAGWKKVEDSACYVDGCGKPMKDDGCGGMEANHLVS